MTEPPPVNGHGRRVATRLYLRRVIRDRLRAERPAIKREDVTAVLDAYHDLIWQLLLADSEVRLGPVGRIRLTVREGWIQEDGATGATLLVPQQPTLTGKLSGQLKAAYYELSGVRYPEPLDLADYIEDF